MRVFLLAALLVGAALSGCTFFGEGEASDEPPVPAGAHVWMDVVSELPGEAVVIATVDGGEPVQVRVGGGKTASAPVPVGAHGTHVADFSYSWSGGGEGASGSNRAPFDSSGCAESFRIVLTLSTSEEGAFSSWKTTCDPA